MRKGKTANKFRTVSITNIDNRKKKRKFFIEIALLTFFLLCITIGTSYAFFKATIHAEKNQKVKAGSFEILFKEGNTIHLENATPMSDEEGLRTDEYSFTISNKGDIGAKYNLGFEQTNINENTLDKKYIKYSIKEENGEWSSPQLLSNGLMIRNERLLNVNEEVTYKLKLWLAEEADNSVFQKSFSAKIVVSATQDVEKAENHIAPIINISNTSINISQNDEFTDPIPYEIKDSSNQPIDSSKIEKTYEYYDGENTTVVDHIDTTKLGIYYIFYRVTDQFGNTGCSVVSVSINQSSNSTPTIQLLGDDHIEIKQGEAYQELGASAQDVEDGNLNDKIVTIGTVNTHIEGEYPVKYIVIDRQGNTASITRVVNVIHKGNIEITVKEITKQNKNYQIQVNMKSEDGNLVGYYLSNQPNKPTSVEYTKLESPTNDYDHTFSVEKIGLYYLYVYDTNDNVKTKEIIVEPTQTNSRPTCIFSNQEYIMLGKSTINLICTDEDEITSYQLSKNHFDINQSDIAQITHVSEAKKIDDGYQYTIDINGLKAGKFNLRLKQDSITNKSGHSNLAVEKEITVQNLTSGIENDELDIEVGEEKQLSIENNIGNLTYTSNNPDIASVDAEGKITGVAVGTTKITVTDTKTQATIHIKINVYKTVHINWVANGSTLSSTNSSCRITANQESCTITSPAIEREGYQIIGYNQNKDDTTSTWDTNSEKEVSENATYYAITKKNIMIKVYYSNHGDVLTNTTNQTIYNQHTGTYEVADEIKNSLGLEGAEYIGLSSNLNSIETINEFTNIKTNQTYYAVYQGNIDIEFHYYQDEAQNTITTNHEIHQVLINKDDEKYTIKENQTIEIPTEVLTSTGIEHAKYYGLSNIASSKDALNHITTQNKHYYAIYQGKWTINYKADTQSILEINKSRDSCDHYSVTDGTVYHTESENCTVTLPNIVEKSHYKDGKWYDQDQIIGNKNGTYEITENKELTARATPNVYTVTYNCRENGGTCEIENQQVTYNNKADITKSANKEGYDFLGWNTNKEATEGLSDAPTVTEDMTLYAIFKKSTSITLDAKTQEYTGEEIEANKAIVQNGPTEPQITYQYYADNECKTPINIPIDAGKYYVQATVAKADNFKEAQSDCVSHTIVPKTITVEWNNVGPFIYNKEEQAPEYQITEQIEGEELELSQTKFVNSGNHTTKLSIINVIGGRARKENYELQNDCYNYEITPADGYIVLSSESREIEQGTDTDTFSILDHHGGQLSVIKQTNNDAQVTLEENNVNITNLSQLPIGTVLTIRVTCLATTNYYTATKDYTITIKRPAVNPADAVARIEDEYYASLEDALLDARESGDTIIMLKDTTESVVNEKNVTIDLNGKTVTGLNNTTITNNGILTIINTGTIRNTTDTAILNTATLTLGENDGEVSKDQPRIEGIEAGIKQDNTMNFYDGVITAKIGIKGYVQDKPEGYVVFVDHDNSNGYQKVYLEDEASIITRAVAKTVKYSSNTYYFNLQDAINTITLLEDKGTIYAVRDFEAAYTLTVENNKQVIIDIIGYTVETGYTITNNGYLKITDSSTTKGILKPSIAITNNNQLDIEGITITQTTNRNVIDNSGNLNLISSNINATSGYGVNAIKGQLEIDNNSYINSASSNALYINSNEKTIINNGNYSSSSTNAIQINTNAQAEFNNINIITGNYNGIYNLGTTTINNANIDVTNTSITNGGTIEIHGGTYKGKSVVSNSGIANIIEGHYEGPIESSGTINIGDKNDKTKIPYIITENTGIVLHRAGTANIYNINIESNVGITTNSYFYPITINIYDGTIKGTTKGISLSQNKYLSSLNIYGGKISSDNFGVYSEYNTVASNIITIGNKEDDVSTTTPEIIGGKYGLYISGTGAISFYDGILKGKTEGYYGRISTFPTGYEIETGEETIDGELYKTAYLGESTNFLRVGDNEYNTFKKAIDAIDTSGTIEVIESASITEEVSIPNDKDIILDLGGKQLTNSKMITNKGKLKVIDSSPDATGIYTNTSNVSSEYAINSTNDITVESGNIKITGAAGGIYISGKGNITGGTYYSYPSSSGKRFLYIATDMNITGGNFITNNYSTAMEIIASKTVNIKGIEVNGNGSGIIVNQGTNLLIEESNISTSYAITTSNYRAANITIKSGTYGSIENNGNMGSNNYGTTIIGDSEDETKIPIIKGITSSGVLNIYNGEITNSTGIITSSGYSSTINIYNGTITGTSSYGINASGPATINIFDGKITGKTHGIYLNNVNSKLTIGNNEDDVSTTTPEIIGEQYGLYINNGSTSFYDGILKGKTAGNTGVISTLPEGYGLETGEETIEGELYKTTYLGEMTNFLKVGDVEYNTFKKAIDAIDTSGTIEVIESTSIAEEVSIPNGKDIILDLGGKQLTNSKMITNKGKLKVIDSSPDTTGIYTNTSNVSNEYAINSTNDITLESGNIKITGKAKGIYISGKGSITGGTYYYSAGNRFLYIATDMDITGGSFVTNQGATMEIDASKTVNIKGIEISGNGGGILVNQGTNLLIEESNISTSSAITTSNYRAANITIKSGTYASIENNGSMGSNNYGTTIIGDSEDETKIPIIKGITSSGVLNIYNGEITNSTGIIPSRNYSSTINIYNGTITGTSSYGIDASGYSTINIFGGKIIGKTHGIYLNNSNAKLTIGNSEDDVSTTTPEIIGEQYGLYINNGSTSFYDGILKGKTEGYYGNISNIPNDYIIDEETELIDEAIYQTNYLIEAEYFIQNGETKYNSLKTAVEEAQDGDTLTVIKDYKVFDSVDTAEKNITLDLNGQHLNLQKDIINNGTLSIVDSGDNGKISTNKNTILVANKGNLILGDILLENSTNYYLINNYDGSNMEANNTSFNGNAGIVNQSGATLVADYITLNAKSTGIYNYSNCKINNSTLTKNNYDYYQQGQLFYNHSNADTHNVVLENNTYNSDVTSYYFHGISNSSGTLTIKNGQVNSSIENASGAILNLLNANIRLDFDTSNTIINNYGKELNIDGGSISSSTNRDSKLYLQSPTTIKNAEMTFTSTDNRDLYAIDLRNNNANLILENVNINMENTSSNGKLRGISISNGNATIRNTNINLSSNANGTGIYLGNSNYNAVLESGSINVNSKNAYAYGVYIDNGTVTMGILDGSGTKNADVSIKNPLIQAIGASSGIGVKKVNGLFKYYDGKIIGSTNAKPETTTKVEPGYETRFYTDEETGYEYCILEFME